MSSFKSLRFVAMLTAIIAGHRPVSIAAQTFVPLVRTRVDSVSRDSAGKERLVPSSTPTAVKHLALYLDGALKASNDKAGGSGNASAASGSLGILSAHPNFTFLAQMTIAAKTDTSVDGFGPALLVPGTGKALNSGLLEWRHSLAPWLPQKWRNAPILGDDHLQTRLYGSVSTGIWHRPDSGAVKHQAVEVTPVGYGAGLSYLVDSGTVEGKLVSVGLVLNYTQRLIHGDIAGPNFAAERDTILGTRRTSFSGYEAGIELQYGDIRGALTFYSFPRSASVAGFTRGQVAAGFAIKSDLLSKTAAVPEKSSDGSSGKSK